jgi:hypothetical protein
MGAEHRRLSLASVGPNGRSVATSGVLPHRSARSLGAYAVTVARSSALLLAFAAFGLVSSLIPPFFSNQNTYLVHGAVMSGGYPRLARDWFANTADPTPAFSLFAAGMLALGGPRALVLANSVLGAGFLGALTLCAEKMSRSQVTATSRFCLASALGAAWFALPSPIDTALFSGVADQYVYRGFLQPASFGVLLIWAVWAFSSRRQGLGVALGAVAVWMHPTYLLPFASLLVAGVSVATGWPWRQRLGLVLVGLVLILPPALWSMARFSPTSKSAFAAALDILANQRLPHHTDPKAWLCATVAAQLAVVGAGLFLARRESRVLLVAFALPGLGLTIVAACAPHFDCLRLVFPWRFSAILVPICVAVLFAHAGGALLEARRSIAWLAGLAFVLSASKAAHSGYLLVHRDPAPHVELLSKAELWSGLQRSDRPTVLTPPEWEDVRLNAAVPIFVDYKSHPYKDTEVLAWWKRIELARHFYRGSRDARCETLATIIALEPSLGWVVTAAHDELECDGVSPFAFTAQGSVFRLESGL